MIVTADLPDTIPIISLDIFALFPGLDCGFGIVDWRMLAMLDATSKTDFRLVGLIQNRGDEEDMYDVGCAAQILDMNSEKALKAIQTVRMKGLTRFRLVETITGFEPYARAKVKWDEFEADLTPPPPVIEGFNRRRFIKVAYAHLKKHDIHIDFEIDFDDPDDDFVINFVAFNGKFSTAERQALLECKTFVDRYEALMTLMAVESGGRKFKQLQ